MPRTAAADEIAAAGFDDDVVLWSPRARNRTWPKLAHVTEGRAAERALDRPFQYADETAITAFAWPSLGASGLSRSERVQVLREWTDFFAQPTAIRELTLRCRVNDTLLRAVAHQTQLEKLTLQWGSYSDLSELTGMSELTSLRLGGATGIRDLTPLTTLSRLSRLDIEDARRVTDFSPLGKIQSLTELSVGRGINGARWDAESIAFVLDLPNLRRFSWDPRVMDRDYTPLLSLTDCEEVAVTEVEGMTPSLTDLEWALPGMQKVNRQLAERRIPVFGPDDRVAVIAQDVTGRSVFVPPDDGEELDYPPTRHTPPLTGPIVGQTARTLSSTPRTRTERFRIRIDSIASEHTGDVPPNEHIVGEYAFTGVADGPLLVWDSVAPVQDEPDALAEFFAGNTSVQVGPLPMSQSVDASHAPELSDEEFWPLLEYLSGKTGTMASIRVATALAEHDDEFILRWANTLSARALAARPAITHLIDAGTIATDRERDAISATLAHGREKYEEIIAAPSSFDRRWLRAWSAQVLWIGADALRRRRPEVLTVTTALTDWMCGEDDSSADQAEGATDAEPWFWGSRALVRLSGEVRERILLLDFHSVPGQDWTQNAAAAFARLGGVVVAGPEIWESPTGRLQWADVAFSIRRRSTLPLDTYANRYAAGPR